MNTPLPRWGAALGLLGLLLAGPPAAAQPAPAVPPSAAAPPPAEHFVKAGQWAQTRISPSGQRLAVLLTAANGRIVLATMALEGPPQLKLIAGYSDADVQRVEWVNDERLVYEARQPQYLVDEGGLGTFAIDHDGSDQIELVGFRADNEVTGTRIRQRSIPYGWFLHSTLDDGSDDVLVRNYSFNAVGDVELGGLARLSTRVPSLRRIGQNAPPFARQWLLDAKGELRIVATESKGRVALHWRKPGSEQWVRVLDQDALAVDGLRARYLEDDHTLIVEGRRNGRDAEALYALDLRTGVVDPEPLAALDGFDLDATLEIDSRTHRIVGVHTRASRPISLWFTEGLALAQKKVDDALPGRINVLQCGRCESTNHFIVQSNSDKHAGEYLHFDLGKNTLRRLHERRPELAEGTQARRSFHRVASRDGLSLPVYVTHPSGQAPGEAKTSTRLPTVVHVHGGPWVRGFDLGWEPHAQFLASRGYRVIEVEVRGSTGYGWRHFNAGWKAWGTAMQDDLADAVAWAAKEGLVDPSRVCLFGASYGGYAALMAPIRHPGMFRCAASYAGVTDPTLLYTARWGDFNDEIKRYTLPVLVGDPATESTLLDAASPLKRVAELKVPVLLAYGTADRRVPREHADRFLSAARAAGVRVESLAYHDEGHGFYKLENHVDFLRKLEAFLAREMK